MSKVSKKTLIVLAIVLTAAALLFLLFYDSDGLGLKPGRDPSDLRLAQYNTSVKFNTEHFAEVSIVELSSTKIFAFDSAGLDQVFGNKKEDVTYDDIRSAISRLDVPDEFKETFTELANNLEKQYPDLDLRIWNENLKTLQYEELSDEEMSKKGPKLGCYVKSENKIYVLKDHEYEYEGDEKLILTHEMGHTIRDATFEKDGVEYVCTFTNDVDDYNIVNETLTSILSLRSYDKESARMGYSFQSHMVEIMLECMDNYTLADYIGEDVNYFIKKLNETNGDNEAVRMLCLMQLNRDDIEQDDIHYEQSQYYDLYDYVARMYYRKHLSAGMSSEEITAVKDQLVSRIVTDVPEESTREFDKAHFDDYLVQYCSENGIEYDAGAAN